MKLYLLTEEQVKEAYQSGFRLAMETDGGLKEGQEEFINSITQIELPSNEEIEKEVEDYLYKNNKMNFINGAKWMKEQILNQSFFYCQREIEGQSICDKQCEHCKEYYKPLLNQNK